MISNETLRNFLRIYEDCGIERTAKILNISVDSARHYRTLARRRNIIVGVEERMLIIPDPHAPFILENYLEFCKKMYNKYRCTDVMFTGDLLDNHYTSYHETDPDGHSARLELDKAINQLKQWHIAFPIAKVCLGNHDRIPQRKAMTAGISQRWIKTVDEILKFEGWEFAEEFVINNVLYCHGECRKAKQRANSDLISVVQGHYHSESYIYFSVGRTYKIFAMQLGCGFDKNAYALAYGKHFNKPHINCGIVLDNGRHPIIEYMKL